MDSVLRSSAVGRAAALIIMSASAAAGGQIASATSLYDVSINTSSLSGAASTLAFDFISGGGPSNTITIADFNTDGTLGAAGPNSGSVSGALPGTVALDDATDFFNEYLQAETLGATISFQLSATTNGPTGGAIPDTFAFFILDPTANYSLLATTDPTGADSLFTLQIDGSSRGIVGNYSSTPAVSAALVPITSGSGPPSVPEPGPVILVLSGLLAMVSRRRMPCPATEQILNP
jgi:hypothetical protein